MGNIPHKCGAKNVSSLSAATRLTAINKQSSVFTLLVYSFETKNNIANMNPLEISNYLLNVIALEIELIKSEIFF